MMKNKVKKFVNKISFPLLALLLLFNINVLASDNVSEVNTLTVEAATQRAISYSSTLKTLEENKELAEVDAKDTNTTLYNTSEYVELTNLSVELKNLQNQINNYEANKEVTKKSIELSIVECFSTIINAEEKLELYNQELDIAKRELNISEVKAKLGLISNTEYTTEQNNYKATELEQANLEIDIDKAYTSLNKILGYDLNTKYQLELDIEYEELGNANLTAVINKALASSQTIKEKEDAVTVAKYRTEVYSNLYSSETKESVDVNYAQATRALADAKNDMEINITDTYNSIISIENSYKSNNLQLSELENNLTVKQKQLELGKITQIEYDNYLYSVESLKNTIQSQVYEHYVLVQKFNNPDLI